MGSSFDEIMREVEKESGCTREGARFQEKRYRIGESPAAIKMQCHEEKPQETKGTFSDDEDDQA